MHTVLVVDDNRDLADTLALLLEDAGCAPRVAYDAEDALQQIANAPPQTVIIDVALPGISGCDLAARLRKQHGQRMRLLAFTGSSEFTHSELTGAGFDDIMEKPASIDDVLAMVSHDVAEMARRREPHLQQARRHVVDAERRIASLEAIIERLQRRGLSTEDAEKLLATFRQTQQVMLDHLAIEEQRARP